MNEYRANARSPFYRLFLYSREQPGEPHFEVHARPDPEQSGAAAEPAAIVSCSNVEQLGTCLRILGADGWSRFVGEGVAGPLFEYRGCSVEDVVTFLRSNPQSPFDRLTLIASNSTIPEMRKPALINKVTKLS